MHRPPGEFTRWASAYEEDGLSRLLVGLQRRALAALHPTQADRLLDIGCGSGAAVRDAAEIVQFAAGADLCPAMIARAPRLVADTSRVRFLIADAHFLPFSDGAFSALLCTAALRHFTNLDLAVQEMARVLAPGGRLCLADLLTEATHPRSITHLHRRHPYAEASRALANAGLRPTRPIVHATPFGPYFICVATKPSPGAAAVPVMGRRVRRTEPRGNA